MSLTRAVLSAVLIVAVALATSANPSALASSAASEEVAQASGDYGTVSGRVLIQTSPGAVPVPARSGYVFANTSVERSSVVPLGPDGRFVLPYGPVTGSSYPYYLYMRFVSTDSRALPVREWLGNRRGIDGETYPFIEVSGPFQVVELGDVVLEPRKFDVRRVAGSDRFATAATFARQATGEFTGREVIVVNGMDFPDALSAGAFSGHMGAPIVLVTRDSLPRVSRDVIKALDPSQITIVGGIGVVSREVEWELYGLTRPGGNVVRVSGQDRYATSRSMLAELIKTKEVRRLFVVTGRDFPDALAAVGAASRIDTNGGVLLVDGSSPRLDDATIRSISRTRSALSPAARPLAITIVGGPQVVSRGIEQQLRAAGHVVDRVYGADRYETAVAIGDRFFPVDWSVRAHIATGSGFADALSVSGLMGLHSSPLYLSGADCIPRVAYDSLVKRLVNDVRVIGGAGALGANVARVTPCPR